MTRLENTPTLTLADPTPKPATLHRYATPLKLMQFFVVIFMMSHVSACAWFYSAQNDHAWQVLNEERDGCVGVTVGVGVMAKVRFVALTSNSASPYPTRNPLPAGAACWCCLVLIASLTLTLTPTLTRQVGGAVRRDGERGGLRAHVPSVHVLGKKLTLTLTLTLTVTLTLTLNATLTLTSA